MQGSEGVAMQGAAHSRSCRAGPAPCQQQQQPQGRSSSSTVEHARYTERTCTTARSIRRCANTKIARARGVLERREKARSRQVTGQRRRGRSPEICDAPCFLLSRQGGSVGTFAVSLQHR